jgi:hypothetical protein
MADKRCRPIPSFSQKQQTAFWACVERRSDSECWPWRGKYFLRGGYGRFFAFGYKWLAARLVWFFIHESDPAPLCVLHKCDNPKCCNPAHLFLGTDADNAADKAKKGRSAVVVGETNPNAKLTEEDVRLIRSVPVVRGTIVALSRWFGVSRGQIFNIRRGDTWKHLLPERFDEISSESE